jgi:hypothetical protein
VNADKVLHEKLIKRKRSQEKSLKCFRRNLLNSQINVIVTRRKEKATSVWALEGKTAKKKRKVTNVPTRFDNKLNKNIPRALQINLN